MIPELTHWESFYVIVGSSAAALTGLQFVVIALIADVATRVASSLRAIAAFGSPTVVHFSAVLLLSAIITAPWHSISSVASLITIVGLAGILYDFIVFRRALRQDDYRPELSDWIWHTLLPTVAHAALMFAGLAMGRDPTTSLFVVGGASLLLLFIGIHNAWDTVTYLAAGHPESPVRRAREARRQQSRSRETHPRGPER